jgi:hypothetical protein
MEGVEESVVKDLVCSREHHLENMCPKSYVLLVCSFWLPFVVVQSYSG